MVQLAWLSLLHYNLVEMVESRCKLGREHGLLVPHCVGGIWIDPWPHKVHEVS